MLVAGGTAVILPVGVSASTSLCHEFCFVECAM
jgi:hypothetical protein